LVIYNNHNNGNKLTERKFIINARGGGGVQHIIVTQLSSRISELESVTFVRLLCAYYVAAYIRRRLSKLSVLNYVTVILYTCRVYHYIYIHILFGVVEGFEVHNTTCIRTYIYILYLLTTVKRSTCERASKVYCYI